MNNVFVELVKSKIEKFVNDYNLSRQIFVDEKGKLKHSGEFGIYREKTVKSLIEPFLPTRLTVGSGFIITDKNHTSTQCDLIIYDKENTPVIENDGQRFFPIECVAGVIEVKSKLTKTELKNALIKLSNVKKLRCDVGNNLYTHNEYEGHKTFDPNFVSDQIVTLLICEEITDYVYEKDNLNIFFEKTYNGIEKSLFHNMILSIKNGCFMYYDNKEKDWTPVSSYYGKGNDYNVNSILKANSPEYQFKHILVFINYLKMVISMTAIFDVDMTKYLE